MVALVLSGFSVGSFMADYLVANLGLPRSDLAYVYLYGGAATLFTLTPIGGLSDRLGKLPVFRVFAALTVAAVLIVAYLPPVSLPVVLIVTTFLMVVTSARMVPAMALITACAGRAGAAVSSASTPPYSRRRSAWPLCWPEGC